MDGVWTIKWRDFSKVVVPCFQKQMLVHELNKRVIHFNNSKDDLVWLSWSTGSYSVKQDYKVMPNTNLGDKARAFLFVGQEQVSKRQEHFLG